LDRKDLSCLLYSCLNWFDDTKNERITRQYINNYLAHLVTAILLSIPTPRIQVLKNLELTRTMEWDEKLKCYSFIFDGIDPPLKSKKPLYLVLPKTLTNPMKKWIDILRPELIGKSRNFYTVFPNSRGNGIRNEWSSLTKQITQKYLQKSIPPSKFRYISNYIYLSSIL